MCAAFDENVLPNGELRNFYKIGLRWLDPLVEKLRQEVEANESAWYLDEGRQKRISVQRHTQSIFLLRALRPKDCRVSLNDVQRSGPSRVSAHFPHTMRTLAAVASNLDGTLGRALYARLLPHSVVYSHIDEGSYYAARHRYHLVISSQNGSTLRCGDEQVIMHEGELWWFDNKKTHSSENPSDAGRVHLIFDLLPGMMTPPRKHVCHGLPNTTGPS
jgi:hypothetical protein